MKFNGKTALVTGGGRDIGRACAMRLAEDGANVVISYHASAKGADETVVDIERAGGKAFAMQGDLTCENDVNALVAAAIETFGSIDVLVNNTGGLVARHRVEEMPLDHFDAVMAVNFNSVFMMTRAVLQHMKQGAIVNLASQAGRDGGGPGASIYAASKGAVMTFTRALAKELGPNIRVNAICPGMIDTDFHNIFTKDEVRRNVASATPLKREGTSEDVANLAAYLASDEAAFMTGACVDINGGTLFS